MSKKPPSLYRRVARITFRHWQPLLISTVTSMLHVALNGIAVWLTATLISSILTDYGKLMEDHAALLAAGHLSVNDTLKLWTNELILRPTPHETLKVLCLTILIIYCLKNIFLYLKKVLMAQVQFRIVTDIRTDLYRHFHSLSLSFFDERQSGELTAILVSDVTNMKSAMSTAFQKLFEAPINTISMLALMFIISWKLTLVALVVVPLSGLAIITVGKSIRRKSRRTAAQLAGITAIVAETMLSVRVVKAFAMETYETSRFKAEAEKYFRLMMLRARLNFLSSPITETLGVFIGAVLLWFGGQQVLMGQGLSSDDFIRFILIMFAALQPIRNLSDVNMQLQAGIASAERVFRIMDTPPAIQDAPLAIEKIAFDHAITFESVCFHYDDPRKPVLRDISFQIRKGQVIALVGHSGAGKSTIADLIPRFYDVASGSITIDGIDIRQVSVKSLRRLMGIVTQETILFNDTVRANIAYGDTDVSMEDIRKAASAANALDFVEEMSDGFESIVGEKGVRLSGGQRQRLAIARALLKNPPILILDEATSSLDTESEKLVQAAIEELMKDRTVLVIAHRLSTIVNADEIIVLDRGRIVETGTHRELLAAGRQYKELYDNQFRNALTGTERSGYSG
jgi:subfamily B ATP-binding cassette protein MsbA